MDGDLKNELDHFNGSGTVRGRMGDGAQDVQRIQKSTLIYCDLRRTGHSGRAKAQPMWRIKQQLSEEEALVPEHITCKRVHEK